MTSSGPTELPSLDMRQVAASAVCGAKLTQAACIAGGEIPPCQLQTLDSTLAGCPHYPFHCLQRSAIAVQDTCSREAALVAHVP